MFGGRPEQSWARPVTVPGPATGRGTTWVECVHALTRAASVIIPVMTALLLMPIRRSRLRPSSLEGFEPGLTAPEAVNPIWRIVASTAPGLRRAHWNGGWRLLPTFPLAIANERSVVPDGP
jgi:hypothetical protein